jgi:hypothetical protein
LRIKETRPTSLSPMARTAFSSFLNPTGKISTR